MTHSGGKPHTNVGDRGQRYEIRVTGWPRAETSTFGWAASLMGAEKMAEGIWSAPSMNKVEIVDRTDGMIINVARPL